VFALVIVRECGRDIGHQQILGLLVQRQRLLKVEFLVGLLRQLVKSLLPVAVTLGECAADPVHAQPVLGVRIVLDPALARKLRVGLDVLVNAVITVASTGSRMIGQPNTLYSWRP